MEDLKSLITASVAEDMEAYGKLVSRFQKMAYGYAYSILGDFALSEDATQEAFLEAYRKLSDLRDLDAFPAWLRRIVFKHCDRLTRRKHVATVTLDHAAELPGNDTMPDQALDVRETREQMLAAVRDLSGDEREVTTLFYISGHTNKEVAEFLGVPVSTVKSRLHTARAKLRRRMLNMLRDVLKEEGVDERFSSKVINALVAQPRPLNIPSHPVRDAYESICTALPDYEVIADGGELVNESTMMNSWWLQFAYRPDKETILRTETMAPVFQAAKERKAPVKLITAGRVFQAFGDKHPIRHEMNILCIDDGADECAMKNTVQAMLNAVLGPVEITYEPATFHWFAPCYSIQTKVHENTIGLGGCGIMTPETLQQFGFDPTLTSGFLIAIGSLEHWAMVKLGIDNVETLWQKPYIQE